MPLLTLSVDENNIVVVTLRIPSKNTPHVPLTLIFHALDFHDPEEMRGFVTGCLPEEYQLAEFFAPSMEADRKLPQTKNQAVTSLILDYGITGSFDSDDKRIKSRINKFLESKQDVHRKMDEHGIDAKATLLKLYPRVKAMADRKEEPDMAAEISAAEVLSRHQTSQRQEERHACIYRACKELAAYLHQGKIMSVENFLRHRLLAHVGNAATPEIRKAKVRCPF